MKKLFLPAILLFISAHGFWTRAEDSIMYSYDAVIPSYVDFEVGDSVRRTTQKAIRRPLNASQIMYRHLNLNEETSIVEMDTVFDEFDNKHIRFEQRYKGVKVDGQRYYLHYDGMDSRSMNGNFRTVAGVDTTPTISESAALSRATDFLDADEYAWENDTAEMFLREDMDDTLATYYPSGELLIWFDSLQVPKLVYKFKILALQPSGSYTVYVNAHTGAVETVEDNEMAYGQYIGTADTRFYGTRSIITDKVAGKYRLHDHKRGHIITRNMRGKKYATSSPNYYDKDNNWTAAEYHANKVDAALTAHWAAEMTYDYFKTKFGRKGWDGKNGILRLYVNAPLEKDSGNNAYWDGWGIKCGIGTGEPYVALDIVAHEIGHAIKSATANLKCYGESGALNEGFSDIWGACVEHYVLGKSSDIWLMGEKVGVARNMKSPDPLKSSAAYNDSSWRDNRNGDYNHRNSTVFSHWFYLLSEGGSAKNTLGNSYYVSGIGIDKAARIAYNMLTSGLTENSNFADARRVAISKARSYGKDSPEAIAVQNAWYAVGVGLPYVEIIGPDYMCDEAAYTLRNVPQDAVVEWSAGRGLTIDDEDAESAIVRQGTVSVIRPRPQKPVRRPFVGESTLTATVTINGQTVTASKTIEVRKNITPEIERDTTKKLIARVTQYFSVANYSESDSANLQWTITRGGNVVHTAYGQHISYRAGAGAHVVTVRNVKGCEPDNVATMSFTVKKFGGIRMAYANPVSYSVDVNVLEQYEDEATIGLTYGTEPYEGDYTLELWSELYGCVRTVQGDSPTVQIPLGGLNVGTYFIKLLIDGKLETTQQLIVR